MAELFSAVASGAGLISLALQLMETAQKLHSLYHTAKDAPDAVKHLSFELTTMSKHILQLDRLHNPNNSPECSDLLDRCMYTCTRMSQKIKDAVEKIERALQRSIFIGKVYMVFKETEIHKLLDEMEQAKSSMMLAHLQYIEGWKMQQAIKNERIWLQYSTTLALHNDRLESIARTMSDGQRAIMSTITAADHTFRSSLANTSQETNLSPSSSSHVDILHHSRKRPNGKFLRKIRISLPNWFTDTVWEVGTFDMGYDNIQTLQLRFFHVRPMNSAIFKVICSGNVESVRKLLGTGHLSLQDHFRSEWSGSRTCSLLAIAAQYGHTELCRFLFQTIPSYWDDSMMEEGLMCYISNLQWHLAERKDSIVRTRELYHLFLREYGLHIETDVALHPRGWSINYIPMSISDNMLIDHECMIDIVASHPVPLNQWPVLQRASTGLHSRGWPVDVFLKVMNFDKYPDMITQTDCRGRTALHWAAEHCGGWSCSCPWSCDNAKECYKQKEGYGKLVTKLISLGADIYQLDKNGHSPLSAYCNSLDWRLVRFEHNNSPLDHIRMWGELISLGGIPLADYARRENQRLQTLKRAQRTTRHVVLEMVEVSGGSDLIVHMTAYTSVNIWQQRLVPGAWERPLLDKAIEVGDDLSSFVEKPDLWVKSTTQEVVAGRFPGASILPKPRLYLTHQSVYEAWQDIFSSSQDDHLQLAKIMSDDFDRDRRGQHSPTRRRARSHTRSVTPWPDRSPFKPLIPPTVIFERWPFQVHKCLLDGKWTGRTAYRLLSPSGEAGCMLGLCGTSSYRGRSWEDVFIQEDANIDRVYRFVDCFRPQDRAWLDQRLLRRNEEIR